MRLKRSLEGVEREVVLTREFMEQSERRHHEQHQLTRERLQLTREVIRRNEIAFQDARRESADMIEEQRARRGALLEILDHIRGDGDAET